jgi:hypothetical protein
MFNVFFFSEKRVVYTVMWQNTVQPGYRWKYGACALHAGSVRLQTHTQNMQFLLFFNGNNDYATAAQFACWVLRKFPVLRIFPVLRTFLVLPIFPVLRTLPVLRTFPVLPTFPVLRTFLFYVHFLFYLYFMFYVHFPVLRTFPVTCTNKQMEE